jgi:membrane fusion protein, multidrug efflux system
VRESWMRSLIALAVLCGCGSAEPAAPPAVPVVVASVAQRDVRIVREFIGTTQGNVDAEIRAQVSGYLISRDYPEGTIVKRGDPLFTIDARPFRSAFEGARSELERARAAQSKAEQDVARFTPLAQSGAVSQEELDNAVQSARANRAAVEAARAKVEQAQIELGFTKIASPIDGIAGVAKAQIGDLVGPTTSTPLTTVSQVDPIRVATPISERDYMQFADRIRASIEPTTPTSPPAVPLELVLADGSVHPHKGRVVVTGREVDPTTGTIELKTEFPNPNLTVRPGQYARVRAATQTLPNALVVPQRAVTEMQGTHQVAVVGADDVVEMRVVETGPQDGSDVVIAKGLSPGERVVVEGIQKIRNGVVVAPESQVAAPGSAPVVPAPEG